MDSGKGAALVIGATGGIGLAVTRRLLDAGWTVAGVSRSPAAVDHERYTHYRADVRGAGYRDVLGRACAAAPPDVCIYCAGVGEPLDLDHLSVEAEVFEVNLMGAVATIEVVLPAMLAAGRGHIVAISSLADVLRDPGAPSYAASKAGLSAYLEGLALAVRDRGVRVTNVRFGFVDTKMAKSDIKPFEISPERAADVLLRCLDRRPIRCTYPRRMAALLWLVRWPQRLRLWLG